MKYNINQQTSYFLKKKGLTLADLNQHPQIEDVVLLCNIKDEFLNELDATQEGYVAALWSFVYHNNNALKSKHYIRLKQIVKALQSQRQAKQHRQEILRGKILRLKKGSENPATTQQENGRGYMTTNALPATNGAYKLLDNSSVTETPKGS
jgi:hypothetical protein